MAKPSSVISITPRQSMCELVKKKTPSIMLTVAIAAGAANIAAASFQSRQSLRKAAAPKASTIPAFATINHGITPGIGGAVIWITIPATICAANRATQARIRRTAIRKELTFYLLQ